MPRFHDLRVADIRHETADSVSLAFESPAELRQSFRFAPGQYLTLRTRIDGEDVRRPYSICSGLSDGDLRVAIRRVPGGTFSTYAHEVLAVGDVLQVMEPDGQFQAVPVPAAKRNYVGFAAGSGITPILSILKSILEAEPNSHFALFYGNRETTSVMFRETLEDLKNRFSARFSLLHVFSREPQEIELQNGRIDTEKCKRIFSALINVESIDRVFLCGPVEMSASIRAYLIERGVPEQRIATELFTPASDPSARRSARRRPTPVSSGTALPDPDHVSDVTVILDGVSSKLSVPRDGETILEAGLKLRPDLPYACKGGMCCTCRARLISGDVVMDVNYTLAPDEISRGFVLTCQSHPRTPSVVLDYDSR